jgi:hypothetical protein
MIKDMKGDEFTEGCLFIKPFTAGRSAMLEERVAHLRNGRLYGDNSKVAISYPSRCYILKREK